MANLRFHKKNTAKLQKKNRSVPTNLQPKLTKEKERLQEGNIQNLKKSFDENMILPIVLTVEEDRSIEVALNFKVLKKSFIKNIKCQTLKCLLTLDHNM